MKEIILKPIGYVKNNRIDLSDDFWGEIISEIELVEELPKDTLDGIDTYSHLEIIFYFNKIEPEKIIFSGHPRENPDWPKVGIFAQRKKDRPNQIGATIVKLLKREGKKIFVKYLDATNGTPILDIKPIIKEFLPQEEISQPAWATELMKKYWNEKTS